ncbi:Mg2+ and Co2+ transporter CorA [Bacillus ectoiniformans]|uniref:magnesium transporter CorA family protein n=1 Tax=Bacillus ectoiniformans TaxID=1494429 RepID=UPI001958F202|nr:magnesium transporter CorA family protein [Bacillus ectoiniformans]MBM7650115.1 Mg2+ and Co2+ transporter CorA [Bacillus ectoiniformans]
MKYTFNENKWTWFEIDESEDIDFKQLTEKYHTCNDWLDSIEKNEDINTLNMNTQDPGKEVMWGSIIYFQDVEEKGKKDIFHYYLTRDFFITDRLNLSLLDEADQKKMKAKMEQCETPIEGFLTLIGEIVTHILQKIDCFESRLRDLLWNIKEKNNTDLLDQIVQTRHELLIWKNLTTPALEVRMGVIEAFGEEVREAYYYKQTFHRVERARSLINEYQEEISGLVELENIVSSHRGNEIMKTLTVITTLFTPATVWGAIWGMNFKVMPELEWKLGYLLSWGLIIASSVGVYIYLKKKGWMGDILRVQKKNSFFK